MKRLAERQDDLFGRLVERAWGKYGDDESKGWENWILKHWPHKLSFGYWYYLFENLEGSGRYNSSDRCEHWVNWPVWGEWRYLFRNWKGEWSGFKWAWIQLTDETKGQRLICRIKGHPKGEIYYNPGGLEPDHRCQGCGEEIG